MGKSEQNLAELQEELGKVIDTHTRTYQYFVDLLQNSELDPTQRIGARDAAILAGTGGNMYILLSIHNLFSMFLNAYMHEKGYVNNSTDDESLATSEELGLE